MNMVEKHAAEGLVAVAEHGEIVAMLAATRIDSISGLPGGLASRSVFFSEPVYDNSELGVAGLSAIIRKHDEGAARRTLFSEIRPLAADVGERSILQAHGYEFKDYLNYVVDTCLLYTSPSPRDATLSRMPSSA